MPDRELCRVAKAYSRLGQSSATSMELGFSRSRLLGIGLEYADFREYQEGDDVRYIDWRLSARSIDTVTGGYRLYTKLFHVEHMKDIVFVADLTESMLEEEKVAALFYTSSLLLELSHRLADRITLITLSNDVGILRGLRGREAAKVVESMVCRRGAVGGRASIDRVVGLLKTIVRKSTAAVMITDYAHDVEEFKPLIKLRRALMMPIALYITVGRWEVEKPVDRARVMLIDAESGEPIFEDLNEIYRAIKIHINHVKALLTAGGISYIEIQGARDAQNKVVKIAEIYLKTRQRQPT